MKLVVTITNSMTIPSTAFIILIVLSMNCNNDLSSLFVSLLIVHLLITRL